VTPTSEDLLQGLFRKRFGTTLRYSGAAGQLQLLVRLRPRGFCQMQLPQTSRSSANSTYPPPLIINVWASWCGPCRKEAASLERLAWSKAGSRYTVIGVSTDDDRNAALKWLRHSNATISHYIDSGPRWTLEHMLGASTIPVTVLVDADGRVVARFRGARDWDSAESVQLIERAFASRGRPAPAR
jgi:thiol-disulfide isomerase/thioredoxin